MQHELQWQQRERRTPDWPAAVVSGIAAGAILMVLDLFWTTAITDTVPWTMSRMVAAIFMGPQTLQSSEFSVAVVVVALAAHYALGVAFALVLAAVSAPFRLDSSPGIAVATGAVFGTALYLINFYGVVYFFPWFAEVRGWPVFLAHIVFGICAAVLYWKLERRADGASKAV
jgi:hypothetical protein